MAFADNLRQLPPVTHLRGIELFDSQGRHVATLENKPGQAGSVAVYAALAGQFPSIHAEAARQGLALYAEHTADARLHPGKHPNIDRLIDVAEGEGGPYSVKLLPSN